MSEAQRNVIHQSLVRPILVGGAERKPACYLWVIDAVLIFGIGTRWTIGLGIFLLTVGHWGLVKLAKIDPQFFAVARRHFQFQAFYPARATPWALPPRIRPSVPTPRQMRDA